MATDEKTVNAATTSGISKAQIDAGIARVRRFGVDPNKMTEADRLKLQKRGIDPDTFERKAVTWDGLIEEFGLPLGPQVFNSIAKAGWRAVPANRGDLSIETLKDRWIVPRQAKESEEDFNKRMAKHRETRERVERILSEAEGSVK